MSRQFPYLAKSEPVLEFSGHAFEGRADRAFKRAAAAAADSAANTLLGSTDFQSDRISKLAERGKYTTSFAALRRVAKLTETQIAALVDPVGQRLQPLRAAIAFGAIPAEYGPESFVLADLRRMRTPNALAALAACGVISWHSASRRVRAIYCLRALIGSLRS